jgi:hypothetical protein
VRPSHHRYSRRLNKPSFSVNDLMYVMPLGFLLLSDKQNPLSFSLQSDVEGDVGEAVEQVSNDIVASSKYSTVIPLSSLTLEAQNTCRRSTSFGRNYQIELIDYDT